jgi:hypothetical protein
MRSPVKRLALLSFLATFVPLAFNFSTPLAVHPALAQNPNSTQTPVNQLLQLTGTQEPQIQLLRGISVRAEPIQKDFQGSKWRFYPNGKFTFTPQSGTSISGTYAKIGEIC